MVRLTLSAIVVLLWGTSIAVIIESPTLPPPEEGHRNGRAFLILSVTKTFRITSIIPSVTTSIARCYTPTDRPICSKRKRDVHDMEPPPEFQDLDRGADKGKPSLQEELSGVRLESSIEESSSEEWVTLKDLAPYIVGREARGLWGLPVLQSSFVTSTTVWTTKTSVKTLLGSTIETVSYVNCRAPNDPITPACSPGNQVKAKDAIFQHHYEQRPPYGHG